MKTRELILPTTLAAILTGCATQPTPIGPPEVVAQIRKYHTVAVLTFANRTGGQPEKHQAAAAAAGRKLADNIASEIRKTGSFRSVTRSKPGGNAMLISGEITQFDEGSKFWRIMAGSLGVGKAHFGTNIDLRDNRTGKYIHRMTVGGSSRTPLPIYGDTSWYEDPDYMMEGIAQQLAARLAEARSNPSQSEQ